MDHIELKDICNQLRWSTYRLAAVFRLNQSVARRMYEGVVPIDDDIAAWLRKLAKMVANAPPAFERIPLQPEEVGHMIGRLVAALVDIGRLDDAGKEAQDWLNRIEALVSEVPDGPARAAANGQAYTDLTYPTGGT